MRKRKITSVLPDIWQPTVMGFAASMGFAAILTYKFGVVAPSVVSAEISVSNISLQEILRSPLYLHQQILQKLMLIAGANELLAVRLPSVINAVVGLFGFYFIAKAWFSKRIALLGTLLFATSSWLLFIARGGLPDSSYLLLTVPVYGLILLKNNKFSLAGSLFLLISSIVLLYIPGFVWLILPTLVWRRKFILQTLKSLSPWVYGALGLFGVFGIIPLVIAAVHDPTFLLILAGLPKDASVISQIPTLLISGISSLFFFHDSSPLIGVAHLPFIPIATSILIFLGLVRSFNLRKLDRTKVHLLLVVTGLLLHAVSLGDVSLAFVAPFLYLYACGGIVYLLERWLQVFPRNPLAERFALIAAITIVASMSVLGIITYFVAWPHSDAYHTLYSIKTAIQSVTI